MNVDWTWLLIGLAIGYLGHSAIGSVVGKARGAVGA
jgi:hypothetical protein